jgi:hypothetical protein
MRLAQFHQQMPQYGVRISCSCVDRLQSLLVQALYVLTMLLLYYAHTSMQLY